MPNSCSNALSITGSPDALERFQVAAKAGDAVLSFEALYPVPDEGWSNEDIHRWIAQNWGTWLVYPAHIIAARMKPQKRLVYEFVTAWSPPISLIERVALEYPELTFDLRYCERAMAKCGIVTAHGHTFEHVSDPECSHSLSDHAIFRFPPASRFRTIMARM